MYKLLLVIMTCSTLTHSAFAETAKTWETLDKCRLFPQSGNDGDSFHVKCSDKPYLFRLYFTDTPESENSLPERIKEQAAYFGITPERTLMLGKEATEYKKQLITGKDLTIKTLWRNAMGRSKMKRHFAFVTVGGKDLGEMLIENGYSRIYGVRTTLPDGTDSRTYLKKLEALRETAKGKGLGGWAK